MNNFIKNLMNNKTKPNGERLNSPTIKKGIYIMKTLKNILNWLVFLFTGKGEIGNEAVNDGLIDHSGQGRNEYGK